MKKKVLFICTENKDRSRTAEEIFKIDPRFSVKSAGIDRNAVVPLTEELLVWADYVFVMEKEHREYISRKYPKIERDKIKVLGIPDIYQYMDEKLVDILKEKFSVFF